MGQAAVILCGGRSSRMGVPKAWLPFHAEPMLQRIARILGEALAPIVVVAAEAQELPRLPHDVKVVHDRYPDRGPLQAMSDGLAALPDDTTAAFVCGCDCPLVTSAFSLRMLSLLADSPDSQIAAARIENQSHPLGAAYRPAVIPHIKAMLSTGRLKLVGLLDEAPTRFVSAAQLKDVDPELRSLLNVNTPEDLHKAEKLAGDEGVRS